MKALDNKRIKYFEKLSQFKRNGYLAGGTALALQIKHRVSYDFDIFCDKRISRSLILKIRSCFPIGNIAVNNKDEFTFTTKDKVKVSFIHYPFNLDRYLVKSDKNISLLSIQGIALAKAYVLNRRGNWRDYVDLYFILKSGRTNLEKITLESEKIYGEMFSEKLFLSQLLYTEDIPEKEIEEIRFLKEKVSPEEIKNYFKEKISIEN